MATYAANTDVPSDRSRAEIERTLSRYGADAFGYGWEEGRAMVQFRANGRHVRFTLPMPDREDFRLSNHKPPRRRTDAQVDKEFEQAVRQRWRALALVVKAKLEAVEVDVASFEEESLAHIVLPSGQTAGEFLIPQVAIAYENGKMPPMLPAAGETGAA